MRLSTLLATLVCTLSSLTTHAQLDITNATIVPVPNEGVTQQAAIMLQEEIATRSGITLSIAETIPSSGPTILLGTIATIDPQRQVVVPSKPESFGAKNIDQTLYLVGRDTRGALFAAGKLVRLLDYQTSGKLILNDTRTLYQRPDVPYRAHQLAYRNTANTYDAWDIETYEQYIRDLILFGTNGIELIPTLDPNKKDGPVMRETMRSMNLKIAQVLKNYGLDAWLWSPVMDDDIEDVTTPEGIKIALEKRRAMFAAYPTIDHFFVPGGDDGDTPAEYLMPFLAQLAPILKEYHPNAKLWVSNQTFTIEENNYFFDYLASPKADWLHGVVYGPWTKMGWEEIRQRTPERYPIRRYPDITHTVRCQYPVENWDPIFANTLGREPIMPMPFEQYTIYQRYRTISDGFGTYSDGVHDDFNKILWTMLGWDRDVTKQKIMEEYAKVFFRSKKPIGYNVYSLLTVWGHNWKNYPRSHGNINTSRTLWEVIAQNDPDFETNWRTQMYLFRARFDQYVAREAKAQAQYQQEAHTALDHAKSIGVAQSIETARKALAQADTDTPVDAKLRASLQELGLLMHKSIGYQLSVEAPYFARNPERGALLDWLDQPLNDRPWLEQQFKRILAMDSEADQLAAIVEILNWTDPGPGGFYDNLGTKEGNTHVVYQDTWKNDPSGSHSPRVAFPYYKADQATIAKAEAAFEGNNTITSEEKAKGRQAFYARQELRMSWQSQIATHYGTPLKMRYEKLDPNATYRLKVTYAGRYRPTMTLTVDDTFGIHGALAQPKPIWPVVYDIPQIATQDGTLDLEWNLVDGRGCMVAEVWLMKQ